MITIAKSLNGQSLTSETIQSNTDVNKRTTFKWNLGVTWKAKRVHYVKIWSFSKSVTEYAGQFEANSEKFPEKEVNDFFPRRGSCTSALQKTRWRLWLISENFVFTDIWFPGSCESPGRVSDLAHYHHCHLGILDWTLVLPLSPWKDLVNTSTFVIFKCAARFLVFHESFPLSSSFEVTPWDWW